MDTEINNINLDNLIQSKNYVIKNNYWNDNHEIILNNLLNNCSKLSKEYQKKNLLLKSSLKKYRIPIIIISSMGGFLSLANSGYVPVEFNKWVSLFVGFTNLAVTVISLIENFKKIDDTMNKSYISYLNFKKLHDELSIILKIPPQERETNGYDTVNNLFKKYELCLNDSPMLKKNIHDALDIDLLKNELDSLNSNLDNIRNIQNIHVPKTITINELSDDFESNV